MNEPQLLYITHVQYNELVKGHRCINLNRLLEDNNFVQKFQNMFGEAITNLCKEKRTVVYVTEQPNQLV